MADVFSGPRARFLIDGTLVGFAGNVSGTESVDYEPVDVLNLISVKEFVPVAYRASLNAQIFRVIGQSLKALNIFPIGDTQTILSTGVLSCAIEDSQTGEIAAQFTGVNAQEHSFDVGARGLVSENVSFVAIRVFDEFEIPANG